jgi:hypothetical protein
MSETSRTLVHTFRKAAWATPVRRITLVKESRRPRFKELNNWRAESSIVMVFCFGALYRLQIGQSEIRSADAKTRLPKAPGLLTIMHAAFRPTQLLARPL